MFSTRNTLACVALAGVILAASPRSARADSPAPDMYSAHVTANTVEVCVIGGTRHCPGGGDLLRQNISAGTVVKLAEVCTSRQCYLDECVPEGNYRYGYAEPLPCLSKSGTYYFTRAHVTSPLGTCERGAGHPEPVAYSGPLPWTDNAVRCEGTYGKDADAGTHDEDADGGCSVSRSRAQLCVLLLQGLALVAGTVFWRRRAARR